MFLTVVLWTTLHAPVSADRIILRNLQVLSDRRVVGFDEDGLRLDDGMLVSWEQVERARVSPDHQAAFDRMLSDLGNHLYRLHQRLAVGDYRGFLEHAEALYPRYVGRGSEAAYVVFQSLMWGRLAAGQREAAVEPYVRALDYLLQRKSAEVRLPGRRRLSYDRQTGMTAELLPVWFDVQACRTVLPGVLRAVGEMAEPRPEGMRIYYGTLALEAGQWEEARRVLAGVQGEPAKMAELLTIAVAQGEVLLGNSGEALRRLEVTRDRLAPENRPLALYWLGRSRLSDSDSDIRRVGMLQLLELPALYGDVHPELAAAGLYHTLSAFARDGDAAARASLRRELLNHYKQTYHAEQVRQAMLRNTDS